MNSEDLFALLKEYFSKNLDLMRHLTVNACWEYVITENSTNEDNAKLIYYLYKENVSTLKISKNSPSLIPDLILFFTEKSILTLIEGNPDAEEYFTRYKKMMNNPQFRNELDNKINKPRLRLLKLGYRNWQKDFKF